MHEQSTIELGSFTVSDQQTEYNNWGIKIPILLRYEDGAFDVMGSFDLSIYDEKNLQETDPTGGLSERHQTMLEDVDRVYEDIPKWLESFDSHKLLWSGYKRFDNKLPRKVATVCGRLVVVDDICMYQDTTEVQRRVIMDLLFSLLHRFFMAHFVLLKSDVFIPALQTWPHPKCDDLSVKEQQENKAYTVAIKKRTIKEMRKLGFYKTGKDTFILKLSEYFLLCDDEETVLEL